MRLPPPILPSGITRQDTARLRPPGPIIEGKEGSVLRFAPDPAPPDHGSLDGNLGQGIGIDGRGVGAEADEIRQLARLDRAQPALVERGVGAVAGVAANRFVDRDLLPGAPDLAVLSLPGHAALN